MRHPWAMWNEFPDALAMAFICVFLSILSVGSRDWRTALEFAVPIPLIVVGPWLLWAWWRFHGEFKRKFFPNPSVSATIDEHGVSLSREGSTECHLWVGFTKIYEFGRVIVMEMGGKDFVFLPKRVMSGAQLQEFKRLATAGALDCAVRIASA
ncbi:MAG: YcxB family protein [Candidatus Acidiferrales bacterium]